MRSCGDACCDCFKCIFNSCCDCVIKYTIITACCCVLGMACVLMVFYLYYGILKFTMPAASMETVPMYDYDGKDYSDIDKRHLENSDSEDVGEYSSYNYEPGRRSPVNTRNKRNLTRKAPQSGNTKVSNSSTTNSTKPGGKYVLFNGRDTPENYDPDMRVHNSVVDAVFQQVENSDMKEPLGLCRRNANVQMPELQATLFPPEKTLDILTCINDALSHQTKREICFHLNAEMNAYVKWLVLTGEPKEKHKQPKIAIHDDFLFPASCARMDFDDGNSTTTTQCLD